MDHEDWLASRFEEHRPHLHAVARRVLGSTAEADDAVQEAWFRLSRSDADDIGNLGGWLTTVVARLSLDRLRARAARREHPGEGPSPEHEAPETAAGGPEDDAVLADAVGSALLIVLETLGPDERLAFVLHDLFAVPFDQVGPILDRSPDAAKQLASRARRKVRGAGPAAEADPVRQREVVDAFLAASREGDLGRLLALLHPEVALRADPAAVAMGSPARTRGADAVAQTFSGRALGARAALVDGVAGMAWVVGGRAKVAWTFTIDEGRIAGIEMVADPDQLADLQVTLFDGP